jgi:hypothetical protein
MQDSSGMASLQMNPLLTQGTMPNYGNVDISSMANESIYAPNIKV